LTNGHLWLSPGTPWRFFCQKGVDTAMAAFKIVGLPSQLT